MWTSAEADGAIKNITTARNKPYPVDPEEVTDKQGKNSQTAIKNIFVSQHFDVQFRLFSTEDR